LQSNYDKVMLHETEKYNLLGCDNLASIDTVHQLQIQAE